MDYKIGGVELADESTGRTPRISRRGFFREDF
jgi:hypothetical protein